MILLQHSHSTKLFGPKFISFDNWQGLGEQVYWVLFSTNMEGLNEAFFILFLYVVMSNVYVLSAMFNCWIYCEEYHSLVVQA